MPIEMYTIEHNGDCYQSVFPTALAHLSKLHMTVVDALDYMVFECDVPEWDIVVPHDFDLDA